MKKHASLGLIMIAFFFPFSAAAQDKPAEVRFATEAWDHATNADGTGLYWDIFRAVYEPEGINVTFSIRSYSGSVELLKRKKVDAVVAAYKDEIEESHYPKWHFAVDVVQALFKKSRFETFDGQKTMAGKKVAWIKGYALNEYLDVPVEKMEFGERAGALKSLDRDRYDFFLDAQGDLIETLQKGHVNAENYRRETIKQLNLYLAFVKSEKGKKLSEIFDTKFPKLVESGEIRKLYEKWKQGNFTYPFDSLAK